MHSIRKNIYRGHGRLTYRVKVKSFKDSEAMYRFLEKQYNNDWAVMAHPLKSGTYIERGAGPNSELVNIKSIDPTALAHM